MQDPLKRCYEAMPEPKIVIAIGTCAISGGMHAGGYTEANGVDKILPVDIYLPGCPPHPISIIHAIQLAQGKALPGKPILRKKKSAVTAASNPTSGKDELLQKLTPKPAEKLIPSRLAEI